MSEQIDLDEGDPIELSRSHQLKIDGDDNWVGVKIRSRVREGEDPANAYKRLKTAVENVMDQEIDSIVKYVRSKG